MSKAVVVIAPRNFQPIEYAETVDALKRDNIEVVTASTNLNPIANNNSAYSADVLISAINPSDYEAIILIGGSGSSIYFHDEQLHRLIITFVEQRKVVAAICAAPTILAYAGVLKDKQATCFPSHLNDLKSQGAQYCDRDLVEDGQIITANGPEAAGSFGQLIASKLS